MNQISTPTSRSQLNRLPVSRFYPKRLGVVLLGAVGICLLSFFWLLGFPQPLRAAGPHYVASNGVDSANCSISTPCRTIQQAVANAGSGDEIRVAAGLYTGTVTLNKNLTLRGGFTTTNWLTPASGQNTSIIDAQNSSRPLNVLSNIIATVSGFSLTGGNVSGSGGGVSNQGTLTLIDNRIYGNTASAAGGGVTNGATLILNRSQIYSNTTVSGIGGGINIDSGAVVLEASQVFSNSTQFGGGGVYIANGNITIKSSFIYNNTAATAGLGGGILIENGTVKLENNTVYGNLATAQGGGIYATAGTVAITNGLIITNTASFGGGGIFSGTIGSGLSIASTDFFGNSANHIQDNNGVINPTTFGTNNRINNPNLNVNLHLPASGSLALNSGVITVSAAIDIDGEGRPFDAAMDRGADEYVDLSSTCYTRIQNGQVYTTVQAAVDAASAGGTVQVAGRCVSATGQAQTVLLNKNLTVRGGYTVTDWLNASYGPTILDANGQGRVISVTGTAAVTLDSLHITGGSAAGDGAGVYLNSIGLATLQNNVIYGNTANGGTSNGGGLYNSGRGSAVLQHNTFYNNTAGGQGSALYASSSGGSGTVTLQNSIIANNVGSGIATSLAGRLTSNYNDYFSNSGGHLNGPVSFGANDLIDVSPSFEAPAANPPDFRLDYTSQLINAANPASNLSTDFEGDTRPQGTRADIGADESAYYPGVALSDAPGRVFTDVTQIQGQDITFNHTITNTGLNPSLSDTFDLVVTNSNGWPVNLVGIVTPVSLASGASQSFQVVVSVPATVTGSIYNQTIITATSQANVATFDTTTDLIANPGVQLAPNYDQSAKPGEILTYTHTLTNIGPVIDSYIITLNSPFGWGQLIAPTLPITVAPGATALVTARVQVTDTAPANLSDVMLVNATSLNFSGISATVVDTTTAKATVGDRYVAVTGQDTNNNCTRSASPCATIGHGVSQTAFGDTVRVATGTYFEGDISIFQNNLSGGFTTANWITADPEQNVTIIDAKSNKRGLLIQSSPAFRPVVEGFTIRNGVTSGAGGAVYVQGSSAPTLTKLILLNSSAAQGGGGIYLENGNTVLQSITISNTTAPRGGAIYQLSGNVLASKLLISNTNASSQGGGVYQAGGTLTISQTRLSGSTAVNAGGGFYSAGGTSNLWNNFIYNNRVTAGGGGGIFKGTGTLNSINNTLVANQASSVGGGIFANNSTLLVISNTIIVSNTASTGGGIHRTGSGSLSVNYNDVWNNIGGDYSGLTAGANSISAEPLFVNPAAGDFHLSLTSPALDKGDPNTFLTGDIDDEKRPFNQGFDIGADELGGCLAKIETSSEIYGILQQAVDVANVGATIQISGICRGAQDRLVNGQTLSQTVILTKNLTLKGGYNSTFDNNPDTNPQPTILDAQSQGRVMVVTDTVNVTVSRLTLTGGNAAAGGGGANGGAVYNAANQLNLEAMVITGNQATSGGGIYVLTGTLILGNVDGSKPNSIISNIGTNGGGLYVNAGSATISYTLFASNTATTSGGGIYNAGGLINSQSLTITNNSAASGGGLQNTATGVLTLTNSIVASNTVTGNGGGLYNTSNNLAVRHDNFYANSAGGQGGGVYHNASSTAPIINSSIIISNTSGSGGSGIHSAGTNPAFNYNDVFNNTNIGAAGIGNISVSPNFLSIDLATPGFLRIAGGSPVEDKGDPTSPINSDIDGDPRPSNQTFDIGIDEVGGCFVRINLLPPTYGSIQYAVGLSNPGNTLNVAGTCQGVNSFVDGGQTVSQTVFLTKSLTIQGGYNKDNWTEAPNPALYPTILDALNFGRVAYITNSAVISISNLNLRQGTATNGGGIFVGSGVLTLTKNSVYSNTATSGGAIYNAGGTVTVDSNDLHHNQAISGGAFFHAAGVSVVQNNIVRHNTVTGNGGGFYNNSGNNLMVRHNTVYSNTATNGGGFYNSAGNPTVVNTIFATNTVTSVGHAIFSVASFTARFNNAYPAANAYNGSVTPANSLTFNPNFIDPLVGNFHLQSTSPVLDRGDPAMTLFYDFEGDFRPSDQGFDIGADEQASCLARITRTGVVYGNIQTAINNSLPGDTIQVTAVECRGVHGFVNGSQTISQTVHITHNLTLIGGYESDFSELTDPLVSTTLNPVGQGRAMLITNTVAVTISNFGLQNGNAVGLGGRPGGGDAGGGLFYRGSIGMLDNVKIYSNTAGYGGGLFDFGAGLTITNSVVSSNTAGFDGGGIYNHNDTMRLTGNNINQNIARNGGGVYNNTGLMTLERNQIHDNNAINSSAGQGGGFYNNNSTTTLDRGNRFYGNNSDGDGGAIYNNSGNLTVWNTLIYGNTALDQGGGIYLASGNPAVLHNTFYQNNAGNQGGGVHVNSGSPTIKNNIFDSNTAASGSAVRASASGPVLDYNDYWVANGAAQVAGGANPGANSFNVNPRFVAPSLQEDGDFHLQSASGLINVGQNVSVPHDFENDPRPINSAPDVGADEYNACLARVLSTGTIYGRIQTALDNASSDDTVQVAQGICQENITISKNITIIGSWLTDFSAQTTDIDTTIDAANSGNRVITVTSAASVANLAWLRLTNGTSSGNGGGVRSQANQLNMADMEIISNTAANGGGVYLDTGAASSDLSRVLIEDNRANSNGGGVFVGTGLGATLDDVIFNNNTAIAGNGGSIYNGPNSNVTIINGGVVDSQAGGDGGGIYNDTGSQVNLSGGLAVDGNQAQNGGGIYNNGAAFTLFNKQVNNNRATGGNGGGIYVGGASTLDLTNLGLYNNEAQNNGAGLYRNASGSAALYHATIHRNDALTGQGGGVYNANSSMVISASIIAFNTSSSGGSGAHGAASINSAYTLRESSNTYVGVTAGVGNIDGADPHLREPGGDLLYISPAIDAVPTLASHVTQDRFLEPRPQLCAKDMGRDEYLVGARTLTWAGPIPAGPEIVAPTEAATYTFSLRNDSENWTGGSPPFSLGPGSGYTETLTLTLNSSQDWGELIALSGGSNPTVISGTVATVTLGPSQAVTITFRVTVPAGTFADKVDTSTLSYEAYQCAGGALATGTSGPATTNVEESLKFIIAPDNLGAALPGQTITYTHIITNLGNITDTYTIVPGAFLYAPGVIVQPPDPYLITLAPLQTSTLVMSVTVDAAAAGELIGRTNVVGISSSDPTLQESALDSTVISYTTSTRYVSLDGTDSLIDETVGNPDPEAINYKDNNCTQPNQGACRTIQQAINQAADGDLIKIDQGQYTDIFTTTYKSKIISQMAFVNKSVVLQGGYDKDKINPDGSNGWEENPPSHISQTTVIDVQGLGRGVYVTEGISATIDRLNLVNGNAAGLGGEPDGGEAGEADAGGNIYNEGADLTLSANRIHDNDAATVAGGGLYSGGGNLQLYNNLFHDSIANRGGAVYIASGTATVVNNTFYNNSASVEGAALYATNTTLGISNTIVANSNSSDAAVFVASGSAVMDYNLYDSNTNSNIGGIAVAGPNDVSGDPLFAAPLDTPPNLHLQVGSPALEQGDPATTLTLDYDNDTRLLGLGFDIGADERVPSQRLVFYPDTFTTTLVGSTVVQTHTLENQGDLTDTFTITAFSSQPGWGITFDQPVPYTITLAPALSQTVVVTYNVPISASGQTNVTLITATSSLTTIFASVTDTIRVSSPLWQISKTVTSTPTVQPGGTLTYTLYITNAGDLDTTGTYTITDPLPANTNFVSASLPGTFSGGNITWVSSTPIISNGGAISFTYVVTVSRPLTQGTTIVNQNYQVIGGGAPAPGIGVPVIVTVIAPASLSISKAADPTSAQPGEAITYTITVSNEVTALGPALDVVISDTLPAEIVYQSMGFVAPATGIVTDTGSPTLLWQLADPIPVGGSAQVTVTGRVATPLVGSTILTNTFNSTASNISTVVTGVLTNPVTTTNTITLAKTVVPTRTTPGGQVTYTIVISNSGNGLADVAITDTLAAGFNPAGYSANVLVPGRTESTNAGVSTLSFTATVPITPGVYFNPVVTATFDLTETLLTSTAPVTVAAPTVDFSSAAYTVAEDAGTATITVTLSGPSLVTATVNYATSDNTATAGSDYTPVTGVLTFTPGIVIQTFTVPITNDTAFELDELIDLTLSGAGNATVGVDTATLTILNDDSTPEVDFSSATYSVDEGAGTATITVTLSAAFPLTATVDYATTADTATAGSDYTDVSGTLTFTPGITSLTFSVPVTDDPDYEANETISINLSNPISTTIGTNNPAELTIIDNDTPVVDFSSATYTVDEAAASAIITVTLSTNPTLPGSVDYASSNNTATAGSDYTAVNGILNLVPGQTLYTFTMSITNDLSFEGNETLTLTLSNPISAALGIANNPAQLVIVDNDPLPTIDFSSATYSVGEAAGTATITVTLNAASSLTATVNYATSNNSAIAGSDYLTRSGILTFTPGITLMTFSIPITNDTLFEGDETVNLSLSGAANAVVGNTNNPANLTIVDDELAPVVGFSSPTYNVDEAAGTATITVTLSAASNLTATVNYATANNTATAGSDYVAQSGTLIFTPGTTSLTFTVPITNDTVQEGNETITLTLSSPVSATLGITNPATLTIVDDDNPIVDFSSATYSVNEAAGTATITVTLSSPPDLIVTVNYTASNNTATAGSDYTATSGVLTFTVGITSRSFTIPITNDTLFENSETVRLTLSTPNNAILGNTNNPATLTIVDNDTAPIVDFSSSAYSVNEANGTAAITVTLSAASGVTATVNYVTIQNSASTGLDYLGASGTLTFTPGITTQTFAVTILNDTLFENSETLTLTLSVPVSATLGLVNNPAVLTIVDNDPVPTVNFSSPTYSVSEAAGTATITVTLSAASGLTATVDYASSDNTATAGSDYVAASGTLTFTPGITRLTFGIPITNDTLLETNETISLTLSNPISATLGANTPAALTIIDNDTPTVNFASAAYSVNEGAGTATITVTLSFASSLTTTVNYATSNNTAIAGSDYIAQSGTLTFTPGITLQTFTIPISDDAAFEGNETVRLTLSTATNAVLGSANNPATLTIIDNDQAKIHLPIIAKNFVSPPPPNGPDMVITKITLIPVSGNTYKVQVTARNQGNQPVTFGNNFHVNLYLDSNFTTPAIIWGVQASWFGVGQSRLLEANYTFGSGTHNLHAWADAYNVVVEADETNNILTLSGVVVAGAGNEGAQNKSALPVGPQPTPTTVP